MSSRLCGAVLAACMAMCAVVTVNGEILFYPTAARSLTNMYDSAVWHLNRKEFLEKHAYGVRFSKGTGGPFSPTNAAYSVVSDKPQPGYWISSIKVQPKRVYLAGGWFRFGNAKILLDYTGYAADGGKPFDERLYYFSGFNPQLRPYFNDVLLKRLGGNPDKWNCMYRLVSFPAKLRNDTICVEYGLYIAAGDMVFSEPFFVDVTDGPRTLDIDIRESKPIQSLSVVDTELRDERWSKTFGTPVTEFKCTLPPEVDAFRGQDTDRPRGHTLIVRYADGTQETFGAPLDNVFKRRM